MHKANSIKMFMFCYLSSYVITFSNPSLTVFRYSISSLSDCFIDITKELDILVVELMLNGDLIYINTLSKNGTVATKPRTYLKETTI